jgi:hypothetical protein
MCSKVVPPSDGLEYHVHTCTRATRAQSPSRKSSQPPHNTDDGLPRPPSGLPPIATKPNGPTPYGSLREKERKKERKGQGKMRVNQQPAASSSQQQPQRPSKCAYDGIPNIQNGQRTEYNPDTCACGRGMDMICLIWLGSEVRRESGG